MSSSGTWSEPPGDDLESSPPRSPIPQDTSIHRPFEQPSSCAEQEWADRKLENGECNDILDKLMAYEGLEDVKQQFLDIKSKVDIYKEQGLNLRSERLNMVFQGNPGTGKTTIARLYGELLQSLGVLDCETIEETSGVQIVTEGISELRSTFRRMARAGGGILLIDEAYQLTASYLGGSGRPALDLILTMIENNIGKIVSIFVGYKDEMKSFFEHNPGLSSRIPYTLHFEDFTDGELWNILRCRIVEKYGGKMQIEGGMGGLYMRIAIRRLAQRRGSRGFGNARAVLNLLDKISKRQARRLVREKRQDKAKTHDLYLFTKEDLIGRDPSAAIKESPAWTQLRKLVGLDQVKGCVKSMISTLQINYDLELQEKKPIEFSLNQLFLGSSGTGKTTVAKLYGQILADLGYLSCGDVVLKNPADFIGDHLGRSETNTKAILEGSVGKVLVIDEAYMLDPGDSNKGENSFKAGVIDTIVSIVQGTPGEDRCIILVGYENPIREMFRNANPGLSRRFPIEQPFRFENFNIAQLEQILRLKMQDQHLTCTEQAIEVARDILQGTLKRLNCTNAGEVDGLLQKAKLNYTRRISGIPREKRNHEVTFEAVDFDPNLGRSSRLDCRELLAGLVHSSVVEQFVHYQNLYFNATDTHDLNPRDFMPTRLVFRGPSGTGKTTTAQKMGEFFHGIGFLSTSEVLEYSATDLLGEYVGGTSPKTRKKLLDGVGRVLLIDEAYRLANGQYESEAVNEMIQFLSQPSHQNNTVVILAGHTAGMQELMGRPALSRIFQEEITFENIPADDCIVLLAKELERYGFSSDGGFLTNPQSPEHAAVKKLFSDMQLTLSWSNARDVKYLAKQIIGRFLGGNSNNAKQTRTLSLAQIEFCMRQMMVLQKNRCANTKGSSTRSSDKSIFPSTSHPPPSWGAPGLTKCAAANTQQAPLPLQSIPRTKIECSANKRVKLSSDDSRAPNRPVSWSPKDFLIHTETQGPAVEINENCQSANHTIVREHEVKYEEGVSDAVKRELREAKEAKNVKRSQIEVDIERLERDKETAEAVQREGKGVLSAISRQEYDAIRDQLQSLRQSLRKEERVQQELKKMGRCKYGYEWTQVAGGFRCEGGMHFVSDCELQSRLL